MLADLLVNLLASAIFGLFAFLIALWKGDAIAEHFREQRRIREWKRIGHGGKAHVEHSLVEAMISISYPTTWQLPALPEDAPKPNPADLAEMTCGVFLGWSAQLRELGTRNIDFNDDDDLRELLNSDPAASQVLALLPRTSDLFGHLAGRLRDEYMLFSGAFQAEWNRALLHAIGELRGASGQIRPYDVTPETEKFFGNTARANLDWSARALTALAELAEAISHGTMPVVTQSAIRVTKIVPLTATGTAPAGQSSPTV